MPDDSAPRRFYAMGQRHALVVDCHPRDLFDRPDQVGIWQRRGIDDRADDDLRDGAYPALWARRRSRIAPAAADGGGFHRDLAVSAAVVHENCAAAASRDNLWRDPGKPADSLVCFSAEGGD